METTIETLEQAIEEGCKIYAVYAPTGEVVKVLDINEPLVRFQDGTDEKVERNDLTAFTWQ
jgi:hypothetical protein